jgi:hypothetical protein
MTTDIDQPTPPPAAMPTDTAMQLGRHLKATLMHLNVAIDLTDAAGVDLYGNSPLAQLVRHAHENVQDLDLWGVNNARANGGGNATYAGTEHWCAQTSGTLPAGPPVGGARWAPTLAPTRAPDVDQPTPPPATMPTATAVQVGRHLKATLMHLNVAVDLADRAGVNVDRVVDPLGRLIRRADHAVEDLDLWGIHNNAANGGGRDTYEAGTAGWCSRPGGTLPTTGGQR